MINANYALRKIYRDRTSHPPVPKYVYCKHALTIFFSSVSIKLHTLINVNRCLEFYLFKVVKGNFFLQEGIRFNHDTRLNIFHSVTVIANNSSKTHFPNFIKLLWKIPNSF